MCGDYYNDYWRSCLWRRLSRAINAARVLQLRWIKKKTKNRIKHEFRTSGNRLLVLWHGFCASLECFPVRFLNVEVIQNYSLVHTFIYFISFYFRFRTYDC